MKAWGTSTTADVGVARAMPTISTTNFKTTQTVVFTLNRQSHKSFLRLLLGTCCVGISDRGFSPE